MELTFVIKPLYKASDALPYTFLPHSFCTKREQQQGFVPSKLTEAEKSAGDIFRNSDQTEV